MRTIRLVMADRGLGRAIAALLVYFVVLQAVAGAVATAGMASPSSPAGIVLCSGATVPASGDHGSERHACCSALCRTACAAASCHAPAAPALAGSIDRRVAHAAPASHGVTGPRPHRLVPEARAPPSVSSPA